MKIIVTGSSSLLGKALTDEFKNKHQLILTYHKTPPDFASHLTIPLDITDSAAVKQLINKHKPNLVMHLASLSNIDYCQAHHDEAQEVNVQGTQNIIQALKNYPKTKFIFLSSSMVFDGDNAPAAETKNPRPLNFYGKTKLEAEQLVQKTKNPWLILRPTTMYGWPPVGARENPVTWVIKKLQITPQMCAQHSSDGVTMEQKHLPIVADYFTNPLYAPHAAHIIHKLIKKQATGIFHIGGTTRVSRFAFAKQVARAFNLPAKNIKPAKMTDFPELASRPQDTTLSIKKVEALLNLKPLSLKEGLKKMKIKAKLWRFWRLKDKATGHL